LYNLYIASDFNQCLQFFKCSAFFQLFCRTFKTKNFRLRSGHFLSTSRQPTYIICVSNELCIPSCCDLIIVPHGSIIPDPLIHKTLPWKPGWRLAVSGKPQELVNYSTSEGCKGMMKPRGRSTEIFINI